MKMVLPRRQVLTLIGMAVGITGGPLRAETPQGVLFTGPGPGGAPDCPFSTLTITPELPWTVFPLDQSGGVNTATGDFDGDGSDEVVCGSESGPHVRVVKWGSRQIVSSFAVQHPAFINGVRVATGDFTGDGIAEIVAGAGPGGGPHVMILSGDGQTVLGAFTPFPETFLGGIDLAVGDLTNDGKPDIVVGAGPGGGPHVKVFDGTNLSQIWDFFAFPPGYDGGVTVTVGRFDSLPGADIAVAPAASVDPPGAEPPVTCFTKTGGIIGTLPASPTGCGAGARLCARDFDQDGFDEICLARQCPKKLQFYHGKTRRPWCALAYNATLAGRGCSAALGDTDGDGEPDLILGGGRGGPPTLARLRPRFKPRHIKPPQPPTFPGGVPVALGDLNGDASPDEFMGCGPGAGSVAVCTGPNGNFVGRYFPFGPTHTAGVTVAGADITGDGRAELIAGTFSGPAVVRILNPITGTQLADFHPFGPAFTGGVSLAGGDLNGDGVADVVAGTRSGGGQVKGFNGSGLGVLKDFQPYGPGSAFGVSVAAGDLNGDGRAEIVTGPGAGGGPQVKVFDGATGAELMSFPAYDAGFTGGVHVAVGDMDGDSQADIITGPGAGLPAEVRFFDGRTGEWFGSYSPLPGVFTGGIYPAGAVLPPARVNLLSFRRDPTGRVSLTLNGSKGRSLAVHRSTDGGATWTEVEARPATDAPEEFNFPTAEKNEFFRGFSD